MKQRIKLETWKLGNLGVESGKQFVKFLKRKQGLSLSHMHLDAKFAMMTYLTQIVL